MGKRTNILAREPQNKDNAEPETVLTFNTQVEDPVLNAPKKVKEEPKEEVQEIQLPDFMKAAIASNVPLKVTDDPEKAGTLIQDGDIQKPNDITPPIKAALNEFDLANAAKREMMAKANAQRELLNKEREVYENRKRLRSIAIPSLPSNFLPYPEGTRVAYLPYTVTDLESINNDDIPLLDKYRIILEGVVTDGILPTELTFADFLFVSDTRHLQALGDVHYKYPYVCQSCGKPGTYQFTLSEIGFTPLKAKLPVNVRFHTFPDEVFQFVPHTIGDVIRLLDFDRYWKRLGSEYLTTEAGQKQVDRIAINACRCISHPWETAYFKLLEVSENPEDRLILDSIDNILYHSTEPIKFNCVIPLDKDDQRTMAEQTANLVEGVTTGDISTTTPNEEKEGLPPWMQALADSGAIDVSNLDKTSSPRKKVCNAVNTIDVLGGDIIIPFRKHTVDMEYGILSGEVE